MISYSSRDTSVSYPNWLRSAESRDLVSERSESPILNKRMRKVSKLVKFKLITVMMVSAFMSCWINVVVYKSSWHSDWHQCKHSANHKWVLWSELSACTRMCLKFKVPAGAIICGISIAQDRLSQFIPILYHGQGFYCNVCFWTRTEDNNILQSRRKYVFSILSRLKFCVMITALLNNEMKKTYLALNS